MEGLFWRCNLADSNNSAHMTCLPLYKCELSVCLDCTENNRLAYPCFFVWSRALFTEPASTDFNKFFFKIGSHSTIHIFKNYFVTVFSVISGF